MIGKEAFVTLLRNELGLPVGEADLALDFDDLAGWDSVHVVALVAALERHTGLRLSLPAVLEAPTLASVYQLLADERERSTNDVAQATPAPMTPLGPSPKSTATVTVAITGHGVTASLVPALRDELGRHGLALNAVTTAFDSYVFELGDPASRLYQAKADLTLCLLDPLMVFDKVPRPFSPAAVEQAFSDTLSVLEDLASRFASTAAGILVFNTIPLPRRLAAQLVDHRSRAKLGAVWRSANCRLLQLADRFPAAVIVDLDPLLAEGIAASDTRSSIYAKAHLAEPMLAAYAREVAHLARHQAGRAKKCLVVDLDGTLWGGILGDDGFDGIVLGEGLRGEAFGEFQRVVKQIGAQGVLLAAVSKNEREPVLRVLREHPQMVLREDDFVRIVANWRPKPENLVELAEMLNLTTDSFVFVDDSAFECAFVGKELPAVAVVELGEDPATHVERLLADDWFAVPELVGEDGVRTARYRDEVVREEFRRGFTSISEFLRELDIQVRLAPATEAEVARVAQITMRTNQFNLTTQRLTTTDVRGLVADPGCGVLVIESADRFGGNGLVGAIVTRRDGDALEIENFLLSCRVFSRGIEQACLLTLLGHLRDSGVRAVRAKYRPTMKNHIVRDFYPAHGFVEVASPLEGVTCFEHDLIAVGPPPDHVRLTAMLEPNFVPSP